MDSAEQRNPKASTLFEQIAARYHDTLARIDEAALRSGRTGKDVLLVAVTKYAEPDDGIVEGLLRSGVYDLAENRPQRFLEKVNYWSKTDYWAPEERHGFVPLDLRKSETHKINWHFIGNLQRNKARRILPYVSLIHSVDSWKLLEALDRILEEENQRIPNEDDLKFPERVSVLLEVHISQDETKQGFTFSEILDVLPKASELKHINVCGLMGMAGLKATKDETRRQFASLREAMDRCRALCPDPSTFNELSMGMSGDFEIAIEEGSTIVRLGSILYPNRS
ncbi:MAG: YggS family pyridoxal phosphate-dependent enzyme [Thermoguttaceae bacterium]|nr:YggS family pyridoxal phosphate-dependent enzyme [Thermoguttaceae bacterium]